MTKAMSPVEYVRQYNPELADAFQALRLAAISGPLDETTCELIIVGALVSHGEEGSLKVHVRRLRKLGVPREALHQAAHSTLAASATFSAVVGALRWIDDVFAEDV